MMTMRKILWMGLVSSSLALGACDKGDDAKTAKTDAKAKTAKTDAKAKADDAKADDAKADDAKADDAKPDADVFDARVEKAAGLAKKIEAEPARADEILAEAGLDRSSFDALIYEVSTPELAEQYRLARAREDG